MKKMFFILALICSIGASAQTNLKTMSVACNINDAGFSQWYSVSSVVSISGNNITISSDISFSTSTNTFSIDQTKYQTFICNSFEEGTSLNGQGIGYKYLKLKATDKDGMRCTVTLMYFDDGDMMMLVAYNNVKYKYMLGKLE